MSITHRHLILCHQSALQLRSENPRAQLYELEDHTPTWCIKLIVWIVCPTFNSIELGVCPICGEGDRISHAWFLYDLMYIISCEGYRRLTAFPQNKTNSNYVSELTRITHLLNIKFFLCFILCDSQKVLFGTQTLESSTSWWMYMLLLAVILLYSLLRLNL